MEIFQRKKKEEEIKEKKNTSRNITCVTTSLWKGLGMVSLFVASDSCRFRKTLTQHTAKILLLASFRPSTFLGAATRLSLPHFASSLRRLSTVSRIMATAKRSFKRLPTNVLPKNYKLTLQPNLTEFTFTGKEDIEVEVCGILLLYCWQSVIYTCQLFLSQTREIFVSS